MRSGGVSDFVAEVVKGMAKGGVSKGGEYLNKPADEKPAGKKESTVDAVKSSLTAVAKDAGEKKAAQTMNLVVVGLVLYLLVKG